MDRTELLRKIRAAMTIGRKLGRQDAERERAMQNETPEVPNAEELMARVDKMMRAMLPALKLFAFIGKDSRLEFGEMGDKPAIRVLGMDGVPQPELRVIFTDPQSVMDMLAFLLPYSEGATTTAASSDGRILMGQGGSIEDLALRVLVALNGAAYARNEQEEERMAYALATAFGVPTPRNEESKPQ